MTTYTSPFTSRGTAYAGQLSARGTDYESAFSSRLLYIDDEFGELILDEGGDGLLAEGSIEYSPVYTPR